MSKDKISEEEQIEWLNKNLYDYGYNGIDGSLADLAFRLRDEVVKNHRPEWLKACQLIYLNRCPQIRYCSLLEGERFVLEQNPIHWIIASIKAKHLAKENTDVKDS